MTTENDEHERRSRLDKERKRRNKGVAVFLRDIAVIVVAALLISFLIKTFLVRSFFIPSGSMESTLLVNDRIIVNQLEPRFFAISHGDVVVFKDPDGWLPSQPRVSQGPLLDGIESVLSFIGLAPAPDSDEHLIKRVIGLPGDTVECCDEQGRLIVNGEPIDEPYLKNPDAGASPQVGSIPGEFSVTVPEDSIWVMGDNRENSADSRAHLDEAGGGFVPIDDVVGRAILITFPFDRFGWLDNYPETFAAVPRSESSDAAAVR